MSEALHSALSLLACPACRKPLAIAAEDSGVPTVNCSGCQRRYPIVDGIPVLIPNRSL